MRRAAALLVAVTLTACGGGDGDDRSSELAAVVDGALLDADDLGTGWVLKDTADPDEDDDEDRALEECMGRESLTANDLYESDERTFVREGDSLVPSEVTVGGGATADPARIEEIHEILADERLHRCLSETFEQQLGGGQTITLGDLEYDDGLVDVDGVASSWLTIPFTVDTQAVSIDVRVDMVVLSRDQVGAGFFTLRADDAVTDGDLERWAELVARRLTS